MELTTQAQVAIKAANEASGILLKYFRKTEKIEQKGNNPQDVVTEADLLVERRIIAIIQKHFPNHNILAEETGFIEKKSTFTWVIDPLDGTGNFAQGIPYFSCVIALLKGKRPILGVTAAPVEGEVFIAQRGKGAFLIDPSGSEVKLSVSKTDQLSQAFGIIEAGHKNAALLKVADHLVPKIRKFRVMGSTALNLAMLAAGRIDFFVISNISTHDIVSGILLVTEAGGKITTSEPIALDVDKKIEVIASNGKLHNVLSKEIALVG